MNKSNIPKSNIIVISLFSNNREFELDSRRRELHENIYQVYGDFHYNREIPTFIALVDRDLILKHVFVIDRSNYNRTSEYLKVLENEIIGKYFLFENF